MTKNRKKTGERPDVAVERWFDRQLNQLYSDVISEPLPKEFLELIEKLEKTPADDLHRNAQFKALAAQVKRHVLTDETERFPLVKKMQRLDLEAVTAAMKKRKTQLLTEM